MNLSEYRNSTNERKRTDDLLSLMPASGKAALDVGARDGHFSLLLAQRFDKVVALDLEKPFVSHPKVECVQGNAADLAFADASFDFVFCAEVLEHIPSGILAAVCRELERVCGGRLLIGVPYRQDLRAGRTTCQACGGKNPPWGHVNSFDERRLAGLFPRCTIEATTFVGRSTGQTNALSCALMDLAGNPYGTYVQEEACIHCGAAVGPAPERNLGQKVLTKLAFFARDATAMFATPRGNWIHVLLSRRGAPQAGG